jgi:hypothetical protein
MSKQKLFKPIVILLMVLGSTTIALCGLPPSPPSSVPLDGGLFLLIGAGVVVAVKKVFFK